MLQDILAHSVFGPLVLVLVPAIVGYGISLLTRRRQQAESALMAQIQADELASAARRQQGELAQVKQQIDLDKLRHQDALDKIRMEAELAEARRAQTAMLDAERLRLERAQSQKVLVDTLGAQSKTLANIAIVQDKVHELTNSGKSAVDALVVDLRTQIKTIETAASTASLTAAVAIQTLKDLSAADLKAKDIQIALLLGQLAQASPPAAPPLPSQAGPLPAVTPPSDAASAIVAQSPAQTLPVDPQDVPPEPFSS